MSETEQALQIAYDEFEQSACPMCGRPRKECSDPRTDWFPQRLVCYPTRERAAAEALYDAMHEELPFHDGTESSWVKKRSRSHPYHARDGVTILAAAVDLNPEDTFLSGGGSDADEGVESEASDPR